MILSYLSECVNRTIIRDRSVYNWFPCALTMVAKKLHANPRLLLTIGMAVAGFFISMSHYIFNWIYIVQHTPYLDEVFHIPQATKYFQGLFHEWDSKITTLPGLYLLSVGVLKPLSWFIGKDICNVYALRFTNLSACMVNYYLLLSIQGKLQQSKKDVPTLCLDLLSVVNMASFPVLYFFTFLYYTDTVSIMLVLLTYLLHLDKCNVLAAATGLVSVAVRQTNIIWVAFFAAQTVSQIIKKQLSLQKKKVNPNTQRSFRYFPMIWEMLQHVWKRGVNSISNFLTGVFQEMWGYTIVCAGFLVFVYMNGGIVVGDKSAHEAVLHFPQLLYFALFTTSFCLPYFITGVAPFIKFVASHKKFIAFCFLICFLIIWANTHVHPYLLADNRHYTFYIWKRLYERHFMMKYALMPVYFFGIFNILRVLRHNDIIFQISYVVCIVLCLVPHKLLEFRYFIIPYLILRLQITQKHWWQVVCEFFLYGSINVATLYLFLTRVFYWNDSDEPQRFLW